MTLVTALTTAGSICGAIVTILGFITLVLKKPKSWIKKIATETYNE